MSAMSSWSFIKVLIHLAFGNFLCILRQYRLGQRRLGRWCLQATFGRANLTPSSGWICQPLLRKCCLEHFKLQLFCRRDYGCSHRRLLFGVRAPKCFIQKAPGQSSVATADFSSIKEEKGCFLVSLPIRSEPFCQISSCKGPQACHYAAASHHEASPWPFACAKPFAHQVSKLASSTFTDWKEVTDEAKEDLDMLVLEALGAFFLDGILRYPGYPEGPLSKQLRSTKRMKC